MPVEKFPTRAEFEPKLKAALGERCVWDSLKATEGVDLTGKTYVVTGANSGIGTETARVLVKRGATVYATARSKDKLADLVKEVGDKLIPLELELTHFSNVDKFVEELKGLNIKFDGFINNAGTMANPFKKTDDGFEMQMQVNYLSVTIIISGLLEHNLIKDDGRIVVVSTCGHLEGDVPVSEANWGDEANYNKWKSYFVSKGFIIMFDNYVAAKLKEAGKKITINSLHPGGIMTNLGRDLTPEDFALFGDMVDQQGSFHPAMKSIPEGAATQLWAATSPELEGKSGEYFENCQITPKDQDGKMFGVELWEVKGVKPYVNNKERQVELIKKTEELLKRKLTVA